jgi:hypothetical protein
MKQRCYNLNHPEYKRYGARGIKICSNWLASFKSFVNDIGTRPSGCSIDRIDPNGNYELGNIRWATPAQQAINRRLKINDEFSTMNISGSRKWEKRNQKKGLCINCGKPRNLSKSFCDKCFLKRAKLSKVKHPFKMLR